jgi:FlaA1/EpsC-like NDP-sugar epimerase
VPLCLTPRIEQIAQTVTGRATSLFAADIARAGAGAARRVLLIGGAGSIGSATAMELLNWANIDTLAVLDPNENNLAELVRSIRNRAQPFSGTLLVEPLDYGSPLAAQFLKEQQPFDTVLSFAALKHVRSERDLFSTLRMLEVNLLKADRFLAMLRTQGHGARGVFFVSTDKAANPVSLMGASKRAMELLLWAHTQPGSVYTPTTGAPLPQVTTARFANVAFSDGSLPWSFLQRLEKRQPLAAPGDIRRYLISPVEAGQLCVLAACATAHRQVVIPRLDPQNDLISFTDIARETLRAFGLEPAWYQDPAMALTQVQRDFAQGKYPVLVTTSDTSGEKDIEEFIARDETAHNHPLAQQLQTIAAPEYIAPLADLLSLIEHAVTGKGACDKTALAQTLHALIPTMAHRETGRSLDGKI